MAITMKGVILMCGFCLYLHKTTHWILLFIGMFMWPAWIIDWLLLNKLFLNVKQIPSKTKCLRMKRLFFFGFVLDTGLTNC